MGRSTMDNLGTSLTTKRKEVIGMKLTDLNLQELIKQAEEHDACGSALIFLRSCSSIEEVLTHKNAPEWAYWYASNVVGGRWPEAEPLILTNIAMTYWYAYNIIKGRWPEAECVILNSSEFSYLYACNIIKGKWPEGERAISLKSNYWKSYNVGLGSCVFERRFIHALAITVVITVFLFAYGLYYFVDMAKQEAESKHISSQGSSTLHAKHSKEHSC